MDEEKAQTMGACLEIYSHKSQIKLPDHQNK